MVAAVPRTCDALWSRSREAGYSLMEILVSASLVSVLLAAAGPGIPKLLGSFALQSATDQIVEDLRLARERAVATNGHARIVFGSGNYAVRRESPAGSGIYVADGATRTLPAGVTVASDPDNPTFDARGLATAPYTITLTNASDTTKTISVTGIGRVNID